ncbi:hypothetical protein [Paenibacillus ginsengarvi]|uniref:MFS transporter n=1 Tax=Paenibacillus ginsengarvi TaxID=400777 RepID=A0A3B0BRF4_9BACL|nr:hypothetical protein [Paenibacillus ginsengarvi]RKN75853.1 hypothetical protein D7M11_25450 [Paenibacillus ginsengarvi]
MNMTTSIAFVTIWLMIRYAGIGLCNSPVTNSAMSAVSKEESGQASGVMNWIRQGLAAMSVSIFSSILASRSAAHQAALPPSAA